jgi:electron transport complex protein RnfD
VAAGPHIGSGAQSTRRMMIDVLLGLLPLIAAAVWFFHFYAIAQMTLCVGGALAAETLFTRMRKKPLPLGDFSAVVTGLILGLSLPSGAPWYVGIVGAFASIGLGKVLFGGLGQNIFNPAMVGRAFVMIAFPAALGASAYILPQGGIDVLTQATPLTALKMTGATTPLGALFLGSTNGSLGETSALAALLGGLYLCLRRAASWEIPAGAFAAVLLTSGVANLFNLQAAWTVGHQLASGAFLFGAFFIATDPVSSPLTPKGKFLFGAGFGLLVLLMRKLSGYPEGVMFSILIMNAVVPLINRATIPVPVGGPVPERK